MGLQTWFPCIQKFSQRGDSLTVQRVVNGVVLVFRSNKVEGANPLSIVTTFECEQERAKSYRLLQAADQGPAMFLSAVGRKMWRGILLTFDVPKDLASFPGLVQLEAPAAPSMFGE